jgi:septal ring factor EnvC (AmiA/AmiB activator)
MHAIRFQAGRAACLALAGFVALAAAYPVFASDLEEQQQRTQRELAAIQNAIGMSEARREELAREIEALENDRKSINQAMIDASARSRDLEARIARNGERLEELRGEEDRIRLSLDSRRGVLAQVLGALLRMGREPPPAMLVEPADALSAVRSAILLGAVVPEIRAEAEVLALELAEQRRISTDIETQRNALAADLSVLAEEERRLNLLLDQKKEMTGQTRQELAGQSARAAELAAQASSLNRLIADLETQITASREAAEAALAAEEERRAAETVRVATSREEAARPDFSDMERMAPAVAFEDARGLLPRPVSGVEVRSFGAPGLRDEPSPGMAIATRANARVFSPADGWVVYAGPFRSYGQLLILNAGSGYHLVLAGMERIDVTLGQFVLAGEPVAAMGAQRIASADTVDIETTRPVLYLEFRKDGTSVDPSPWWADASRKRIADDS